MCVPPPPTFLRRGGASVSFIAAAFDVIMRHRVNTQSWVTCRSSSAVVRELAGMSPEQLDAVIDLLRGGRKATDPAIQNNPFARKFMAAVRFTGSRVPGSPYQCAALRCDAFAGWTLWGHYTLFLTFNPYELSPYLVMELCGCVYSVKLDGSVTGQRPSLFERFQLVVNNPDKCAMFHIAITKAFAEFFCGWPLGAKKQKTKDCVFGELAALILKTECGSRSTLHVHGNALQPTLQADHVVRLFKEGGAELAAAFLAYAEALSCKFLPGDFFSVNPNIPPQWEPAQSTDPGLGLPTPPPAQKARGPANEIKPRERGSSDPRCVEVAAPIPEEWSSNPEELAREIVNLERYIARCMLEMQMHRHTASCVRGCGIGTDLNCRFGKPEIVVDMSSVDVDGYLRLKCKNGCIASFCAAVFVGNPMNHMFSLALDQARWLTRLARALEVNREAGEDTVALPLKLSVQCAAANFTQYTISYTVKNDLADAGPAATLELVAALEKRKAATAAAEGHAHRRVGRFGTSCCGGGCVLCCCGCQRRPPWGRGGGSREERALHDGARAARHPRRHRLPRHAHGAHAAGLLRPLDVVQDSGV